MTIAHSGGAERGFRSEGAPGAAVQGPPLIPPPRGAPATPTERARREGVRRRGARVGNRGPPADGEQGGRGASPPPPHRPTSRRGASPHPPRQGRWSLIPPARERSQSTACPPTPAAGSHRNCGERSSPRQRARTPHRSRLEKAGEHKPEWYGDHAPHDQNDASDTRFVACPGKAEGRSEAERPPALLAPPAAQTGGTAHGPPPPPKNPPPGTRTP